MVPITMPAMAPPERPELSEEEPPLLEPELTTTVVVGCCCCWRVMRWVRPNGRVGVGAMAVGVWLAPVVDEGIPRPVARGTRRLDGSPGTGVAR